MRALPIILALAALAALAACGADAPPEARDSPISFSGDARFGIVGSL